MNLTWDNDCIVFCCRLVRPCQNLVPWTVWRIIWWIYGWKAQCSPSWSCIGGGFFKPSVVSLVLATKPWSSNLCPFWERLLRGGSSIVASECGVAPEMMATPASAALPLQRLHMMVLLSMAGIFFVNISCISNCLYGRNQRQLKGQSRIYIICPNGRSRYSASFNIHPHDETLMNSVNGRGTARGPSDTPYSSSARNLSKFVHALHYPDTRHQ